jgi:hypothetical protein
MKDQKTVVVPPGHKVVAVHPADREQCGFLESGWLLLDFGPGRPWFDLSCTAYSSAKSRPTNVLFVLQRGMIEWLRSHAQVEKFFKLWRSLREDGISGVWVLPLAASAEHDVIAAIRSIGYGVHASAPDGACFVEVHKPGEKIVVGMVGAALS